MAIRITTYNQACELIGFNDMVLANQLFEHLEKFGHTEKSICYAIFKQQISLRNLVSKYYYWKDKDKYAEVNFMCAWQEKIEVYSWKQDDIRWEKHRMQKEKDFIVANIIKKVDENKDENKDEKKQGYVYFVQGQCGGAIKIGYSTNPQDRIKSLQTGYPDTLVVLHMVKADIETERDLHKEFESCRLKGEWFRPDDCLLSKIKDFKKLFGY